MIMGQRLWWPLPVKAAFYRQVVRYCDYLQATRPALSRTSLNNAETALTGSLVRNAEQILESDSLPILSHLINGWGQSTLRGQTFLDSYRAFLHHCGRQQFKILQRHSEGDFHPWQSITYAVMAGVQKSTLIGKNGPSFFSVASNCFDLGTDDAAELGHFLFGAATLGFDRQLCEARLGGSSRTLQELAQLAVQEHFSGSFLVCRKIHLTEGLCAVSSLVESFERYRPLAQEFLNTQLDILIILGTILWLISHNDPSVAREHAIERIQETLAIGRVFENHVFYGGHLLELLAFATLLGFKVSPIHRLAANYVTNWFAKRLPEALRYSSFVECIYQYGHFRRGASLLSSLRSGKDRWPHPSLSNFAIKVDDREQVIAEDRDLVKDPSLSHFDFVTTSIDTDSSLSRIIQAVGAVGTDKLRFVGRFSHFRRLRPLDWPRSLHYEILVDKSVPSIEIHFESDEVAPIGDFLATRVGDLAKLLRRRRVAWHDDWWGKGRGRLRISYDRPPSPTDVSRDFRLLFDATHRELGRKAATVVF